MTGTVTGDGPVTADVVTDCMMQDDGQRDGRRGDILHDAGDGQRDGGRAAVTADVGTDDTA